MLRHLIGFVVVLGCLFTLSATTATAVPINPSSLNPYVHLDASDASTLFSDDAGTILAGDGDGVAVWKDKGSASLDFAQTNAFARPLYATSGFNVQNTPSVDFNGGGGTGQGLLGALASDWKFLNDGTSVTMFMMMQWNSVTGNKLNIPLNSKAGSTSVGFALELDDRTQYSFAGENLTLFITRGVTPQPRHALQIQPPRDTYLLGAPHLTTIQYGTAAGGGTMEYDQSGTVHTSTLAAPFADANPDRAMELSRIGLSVDMDFAEWIVFDSTLTPTQVDGIEEFLTNKYVVPEPTTFTLLGLGLVVGAFWGRRRRDR